MFDQARGEAGITEICMTWETGRRLSSLANNCATKKKIRGSRVLNPRMELPQQVNTQLVISIVVGAKSMPSTRALPCQALDEADICDSMDEMLVCV